MVTQKQAYRVKQGQNFGARKQYQAGAVVQLTEEEASGFLDKLEKVEGNNLTIQPGNVLVKGGLIVTPQGPTTPPDLPTAFDNLRVAILAASDEELIALPGIGEKSVDALRAWAAGEELQTEPDKATATAQVEKELEAETGKDFAQTGQQPPTLAETDKAATDTSGDNAPSTPPVNPPATPGRGNDTGTPILTTGKDAAPKGTGKSK